MKIKKSSNDIDWAKFGAPIYREIFKIDNALKDASKGKRFPGDFLHPDAIRLISNHEKNLSKRLDLLFQMKNSLEDFYNIYYDSDKAQSKIDNILNFIKDLMKNTQEEIDLTKNKKVIQEKKDKLIDDDSKITSREKNSKIREPSEMTNKFKHEIKYNMSVSRNEIEDLVSVLLNIKFSKIEKNFLFKKTAAKIVKIFYEKRNDLPIDKYQIQKLAGLKEPISPYDVFMKKFTPHHYKIFYKHFLITGDTYILQKSTTLTDIPI